MVAYVVPAGGRGPGFGFGVCVRRGGRQTSASVRRGPLPSRWSLTARRPLATGRSTAGMHASDVPAGMWAFMSSNAAATACRRGSGDTLSEASASVVQAVPSRHRVTGAMQLASAAPSASQVSPSVQRATAPAPLHPVTTATTRQPALDAPSTCRGPDGLVVLGGGAVGSVVVVVTAGASVVVVTCGAGVVVVVVLVGEGRVVEDPVPSSRWRRGRWVTLELSREA